MYLAGAYIKDKSDLEYELENIRDIASHQEAKLGLSQEKTNISEIFSEWEAKGLNGDMFICSCDRMSCDTNPYWPFRVFRVGQSIPVLGDFNRNIARSNGFICAIRPK